METERKTYELSQKGKTGVENKYKMVFASKEDLPALSALAKGWADEMGYDVSLEEIKYDIRRFFLSGVVVCVEMDDKTVGLMTGNSLYHFWVKKRIAHEHWFFTDPEYRGKGVGGVLETAFRLWAKSNGCDEVIIYPNTHGSVNLKAIADSLEKRGYKLHGYMMKRSSDV